MSSGGMAFRYDRRDAPLWRAVRRSTRGDCSVGLLCQQSQAALNELILKLIELGLAFQASAHGFVSNDYPTLIAHCEAERPRPTSQPSGPQRSSESRQLSVGYELALRADSERTLRP